MKMFEHLEPKLPGASVSPDRAASLNETTMKTATMQDKPTQFPTTQVNGAPLKPLTQVLLDRRATIHFKPDAVPEAHLEAILRLGAQAPSGYNLQPWRFIVVRDAKNRQRLRAAAMDQPKVSEAPVVIIAFAEKGGWKTHMDAIFREGARRGVGKADQIAGTEQIVNEFLGAFPAPVWLNRHTMIVVTTMMLLAEAYGLDTAPMEGFEPEAVKREFGLPPESEVVALLAIGFAQEPDKGYAGRLSLADMVHEEHFGHPWKGKG